MIHCMIRFITKVYYDCVQSIHNIWFYLRCLTSTVLSACQYIPGRKQRDGVRIKR